MDIYFPNKSSMKCFRSESEANQFRQKEGGRLEKVPVFESKHDVEKWIEDQDDPNWDFRIYNISKSVDNHGNPLEQQTTIRNRGELIARERIPEKPDYPWDHGLKTPPFRAFQ